VCATVSVMVCYSEGGNGENDDVCCSLRLGLLHVSGDMEGNDGVYCR